MTTINEIVLSGGVWQNVTLLTKTYLLLQQEGFVIYHHNRIPPNDGGISLGQAAVAANVFSSLNLEVSMCLGVPGKIIDIYELNGLMMGKIDFGGVIREACLAYVPEAQIGDYTVIHVGFALHLISEEEANETLELLRQISEIDLEAPLSEIG